MGRLALAWLLGVGIGGLAEAEPAARFEFEQTEMAVPIRLVFYARDSENANRAAKLVFGRLRELNQVLSDYDPESELNRLCRTAGGGRGVPVSRDLWTVLAHAQEVARRSEGAFDVTVSPLVRVWRRARRQKELPSQERLEAARQLVGYRLMRLEADHQRVELLKPGMRLDLGGIAKGYAADEAIKLLAAQGIRQVMVYAGGDIRLGDPPPGRKGWTIGVGLTAPAAPPSRMLSLARCAVATSGDMWQFAIIQGNRYSHIVDPRTGVGLTDHSNVTVVAPTGIEADSLSTAISVLGPEKGLPLVDATPGAAALILRAPARPDDCPPSEAPPKAAESRVRQYCSARWPALPQAPMDREGSRPGSGNPPASAAGGSR